MKRFAIILAVLFLSSCTTVRGIHAVAGMKSELAAEQTPPVWDETAPQQPSFVEADLLNALAIFKAADNKAGVACTNAILGHLPELRALNSKPQIAAPVIGAFSGYAAAKVTADALRAKAGTVRKGVPEDVHIACAPLVIDAQTILLRLHQ